LATCPHRLASACLGDSGFVKTRPPTRLARFRFIAGGLFEQGLTRARFFTVVGILLGGCQRKPKSHSPWLISVGSSTSAVHGRCNLMASECSDAGRQGNVADQPFFEIISRSCCELINGVSGKRNFVWPSIAAKSERRLLDAVIGNVKRRGRRLAIACTASCRWANKVWSRVF